MATGFKVLKRKNAVSSELVRRFARLPVANVSDSMWRLTAGGARLRPLHAGGTLAGAAITVKSCPGDNLMAHMALNIAGEGDVIVIDAGGDLTNAIIGERMIAYCVAKKFAGIVVNGAIRDLGWVKNQHFPVYAAGITHRGPYKNGPGEINVPVAIDGMVIEPGDLILGDDDGLLCVPLGQAEQVYKLALKKYEEESSTFDQIGKSDNQEAKYRKLLLELGCEFEE
ncbi:RraA family protein [Candidimonas nitroreducens]|uniref:Putative 4-hydroxy-4-methyl-2-oxoglutarate aldolase n=1 Tax=Candidimonas nitroreducens TaxID=683354 RepID=A0A225MCK5_9BURK|nr:RraA family protein [Candidimonas nitroreducens]OWT58956.1 methyltransferase [Candidimonas nitroreducens]